MCVRRGGGGYVDWEENAAYLHCVFRALLSWEAEVDWEVHTVHLHCVFIIMGRRWGGGTRCHIKDPVFFTHHVPSPSYCHPCFLLWVDNSNRQRSWGDLLKCFRMDHSNVLEWPTQRSWMTHSKVLGRLTGSVTQVSWDDLLKGKTYSKVLGWLTQMSWDDQFKDLRMTYSKSLGWSTQRSCDDILKSLGTT